MQIPSTSIVPDLFLELAKVAPDKWPEAFSPETASVRLKALREALLNPDIHYVVGGLVVHLLNLPTDVVNHKLLGFHDLFNREKILGEQLGIGMFFNELQTIIEQLKEVAAALPEQKQTQQPV